MKPQPERFNAFGKICLGNDQATGRTNTFVKLGHDRWRGRHDPGGDSVQVVGFDRDVSQSRPQPVHPSASQSVSPDNVHLLAGLPRSGPRSQPCQKPDGNVITHAQSGARGSSLSPDDVQSPPLSVPTEAIEFAKMFSDLIDGIDDLTTPQIMFKIKEAMQQMKKANEHDHWISAKGQEELRKMKS